jgi:hypothetical protein
MAQTMETACRVKVGQWEQGAHMCRPLLRPRRQRRVRRLIEEACNRGAGRPSTRRWRRGGGGRPARAAAGAPGGLPGRRAGCPPDHRGAGGPEPDRGDAPLGLGYLLGQRAGSGPARAPGRRDRGGHQPLRRRAAGGAVAAGGPPGPAAATRGDAAARSEPGGGDSPGAAGGRPSVARRGREPGQATTARGTALLGRRRR